MPRRRASIVDVVNLCRKAGGCTEGEVAYWFDLTPTIAYHIWRQLKQLCSSGFLDTEDVRCVAEDTKITFKREGGG